MTRLTRCLWVVDRVLSMLFLTGLQARKWNGSTKSSGLRTAPVPIRKYSDY